MACKESRGKLTEARASVRPPYASEVESNLENLKKNKELPRRIVVIRRSYPDENTEKTELRFVVYQNPNNKVESCILTDAAQYLKERAEELDSKKGTSAPERSNVCRSRSPSPQPKIETKVAVKSNASEEFKRSVLHNSLPVILNLVEDFARMEKNSRRHEYSVLRSMAEKLAKDVEANLKSGGTVTKELLRRIKGLNNLAHNVVSGSTEEITVKQSTSHVSARSFSPSDTSRRLKPTK